MHSGNHSVSSSNKHIKVYINPVIIVNKKSSSKGKFNNGSNIKIERDDDYDDFEDLEELK